MLLTLGGRILYSRFGVMGSVFAVGGLASGVPGGENVRGNLTA